MVGLNFSADTLRFNGRNAPHRIGGRGASRPNGSRHMTGTRKFRNCDFLLVGTGVLTGIFFHLLGFHLLVSRIGYESYTMDELWGGINMCPESTL